uniref:hypothetical protein n=1 Tax=Acetatifactor sp. TaxID=1872090 RepID=UPI004057B0DB
MKKRKPFGGKSTATKHNHIPDIEIIDLELDGNIGRPESKKEKAEADDISEPKPFTQELPEISENFEVPEEDMLVEDTVAQSNKTDVNSLKEKILPKIRPFLNMHMLLAVVAIVFVIAIIGKFSNWGIFVDISEIESDHSLGYLDLLDSFVPVMGEDGRPLADREIKTIVAFGNAPFADDRDSEDNLANMIAEASGATVYNCSVTNSSLACQHPYFDASIAPLDAYNFYWLSVLATTGANTHYYPEAAEALGDKTPPDAQEVYDTLTTLDFNTVDAIVIMYDALDYLMGRQMYDDLNRTNVQTFAGNLEAGIELFQQKYPHIRIIVMSPTYGYGLDENGEYVSSDIQTYYGQDVLSTYVIKQSDSAYYRGVSFVDNLYGTITEDNAKDYLIDHLHINVEGRKLLTKRFMEALTFDK